MFNLRKCRDKNVGDVRFCCARREVESLQGAEKLSCVSSEAAAEWCCVRGGCSVVESRNQFLGKKEKKKADEVKQRQEGRKDGWQVYRGFA